MEVRTSFYFLGGMVVCLVAVMGDRPAECLQTIDFETLREWVQA